ncbi:MAG: exodeoxyribonuclease III [Bdellovibrionales bacterium]
MIIASWNVNSVRARLPLLLKWLSEAQPDVLLLQELKCMDEDFPRLEVESMGYKTAVWGQKSYNGVAILSRYPLQEVHRGLPEDENGQARYLEALIQGVRVASVYAPNGNPVGTEKYEYKIDWMSKLKRYIKTLLVSEMPFIMGGDFNVIPEERDVFDPKGWEKDALFLPQTRAAWREILHLGVRDAFRALHPEETAFSFWAYQNGAWQRDEGLRIDHFLLSPEIADRLEKCYFDRTPRGWDKPSDHTPVVMEI